MIHIAAFMRVHRATVCHRGAVAISAGGRADPASLLTHRSTLRLLADQHRLACRLISTLTRPNTSKIFNWVRSATELGNLPFLPVMHILA